MFVFLPAAMSPQRSAQETINEAARGICKLVLICLGISKINVPKIEERKKKNDRARGQPLWEVHRVGMKLASPCGYVGYVGLWVQVGL